ncbi:MAG: neutral/alkaline non-lysosomal ceramidase N-terminal domain-containing protein [Pirellulaceae bacterium]|nr:neutral/alkaline non-lysosomal ceramidase N-terminal domain-containing protein [Planctomycetales bacterium]
MLFEFSPMGYVRILFVWMVLWTTLADAAETWRGGVAKVEITPQQPMWMAGYAARNHPAEGTLTPLWAKALVLEDATGTAGVIVTLDLVGIDRALSQEVCETISQRHGLPRERVVLNVSHTHSGPVVGGNLRPMHLDVLTAEQQQMVRDYSAHLQDKILQAVDEARASLEPVLLAKATGIATFAVNRRNNAEGNVPDLRLHGQLVGPYCHDVPVLTVRDGGSALKAVLFGYACHATVLDAYQWSGDYPGFAQLELEHRFPGAVAMFWAGCGADQNPIPRRQVELAKQYGQRLAVAVEEVVAGTMENLAPKLAAQYREIDLPLDDLPTVDQWNSDVNSNDRYRAARAKFWMEQTQLGNPPSQTYPYPVQIWRLGERLDWIFLGGEVVVDYALQLNRTTDGQVRWVAGYSNDVMAYIPSRRVWQEGGYEGAGAMVYYGLPTRWAEDVDQRIYRAVADLTTQLDQSH